MMLLFVWSYVFMILLWAGDSNGSKSLNVNKDMLSRLLNALEKVYDFFESEYKDVNLDGIYGLRVSEGALLKILNEQNSGRLNLSRSLITRISELERKAAMTANRSLPHLKQSNPIYYKKFATAVTKPWENFKPFKRLDYSFYVPVNKRSQISFDEDTSDRCMTEMTGTGESIQQPCQLSSHCWDLMMAKGADGYALTHQALFLLIGEVQGCKKAMLDKLQTEKSEVSLQHVYDRICASMYPQMVEFEKTHRRNAPQYERDLYMEQAMVCGSMGYYEFLSVKRLKMILQWQRKNGCFGGAEDDDLSRRTLPKANQKTFKNDLEETQYDVMKGYDFKDGANSRKLMGMRTMRSLLVEKALSGGCMSHITGVATGLLGVYLRWAVHLMYPAKKFQTTKKMTKDLHEQTHHMVQRKVMQNEPLVAIHKQHEYHNMTIPAYFLLVGFVLLWIFCHQFIIKQSSDFLRILTGFCRKTESRIWDKEAVQKRNI